MLQINIYRLLAFCAVALVLLDLLVITKLNVVRLYPLFPANFYFSYGSIIPYALMAFIMMVASWRIAITPFIYVVLACYSIFVGSFYGNNDVISDVRYWALGLFCLYLFSKPEVLRGIVNIRTVFLHIALFAELSLALFLYFFPGFLGFPGYGMGVPAYLFSFYLARGKYFFAFWALTLTVFQGKRGFILATIILLVVFLYSKNRIMFLMACVLSVVWLLVFAGGFQEFRLLLDVFRLGANVGGNLTDLAESASLGRVNEFLGAISLFEGEKWIVGLGIGFEFERIAYSGEFKGMTGYTHTTPFNFYLVAGVFGVAFFTACSWRSFSKGIVMARDHMRLEPLYISIIAFVSSFFSFWSAVSPWFWVFIAFGIVPTYVYGSLGRQILVEPHRGGVTPTRKRSPDSAGWASA